MLNFKCFSSDLSFSGLSWKLYPLFPWHLISLKLSYNGKRTQSIGSCGQSFLLTWENNNNVPLKVLEFRQYSQNVMKHVILYFFFFFFWAWCWQQESCETSHRNYPNDCIVSNVVRYKMEQPQGFWKRLLVLLDTGVNPGN